MISVRMVVLAVAIAALVLGAIDAFVAVEQSRAVDAADMREVRLLTDRYLDAYARHDGQGICAALMPEVRERLAEGRPPGGCARELARLSRIAELVPPTRPHVQVRPARDSDEGDGIVVVFDYPDGSGVGMNAERVDGHWLFDSDQTCVTPSCQP